MTAKEFLKQKGKIRISDKTRYIHAPLIDGKELIELFEDYANQQLSEAVEKKCKCDNCGGETISEL